MTTSKGGRPATGAIRWRFNPDLEVNRFQWFGRVQKANGSRPWAPLDPSIGKDEEERARACAVDTARWFRENPQGDAEVKETCDEWFKRFHTHKEKRGLSTVAEMRGRYKKWVSGAIGAKAPAAIGRDDLEAIVRRLDKAIDTWKKASGQRGQGISPSTAANIWGDVVHAFDEMVRSKDPTLRVLTASPCANVRGPETDDDREGQILYSDELLALLRGVPSDPGGTPVPLYRRQAYAVATYTKARSSEIEAITAADVDLAHGCITIDRQADRKSKGRAETKRTKTRKVRTIDVEPNLRPLVEWLLKNPQGKKGRLVHLPPPEDRADMLRRDLGRSAPGARRCTSPTSSSARSPSTTCATPA
jgi:integrase